MSQTLRQFRDKFLVEIYSNNKVRLRHKTQNQSGGAKRRHVDLGVLFVF
jgi:hypothetical protein